MIRRDFMRRTSKLALVGLVPQAWSYARGNNTYSLVDTPEKRANYLKTMLKRLCTDLGSHPTGTPEFEKAATIIRDDLKAGIPMTDFDRYPFEKWELVGKPEFIVGNSSLETFPSSPRPGRVGTPPEGVYIPHDDAYFTLGFNPDRRGDPGVYVYRVAENTWYRVNIPPPAGRYMKNIVRPNLSITYDSIHDLVMMLICEIPYSNLCNTQVYALKYNHKNAGYEK